MIDSPLGFDPSDPVDELRKQESLRTIREGAKLFRDAMTTNWGRQCAITQTSVDPTLEAAHIYRYGGVKTNHERNGILLRADDLEHLFERHEQDEDDEENAFFSDENDRPEFVQLERVSLHRVFNNGSFQQRGRFYGGWWQQVPSRLRRYITINGWPTREIDYSNLHLAMIYAKEGLPLDGDAYAIDGLDARYRKLVKVTLLKLINAPPETRAGPGCLDSAPLDLSGFLPGYAERGALRFCRCVGRA
ncbi:hypothetical protein ACVME8_004616 [Bradyrhizobium diazoefficiens]